ncbi:hypothetical protein J3F84DRAFT_376189 [Trichoderma pleuroticola]
MGTSQKDPRYYIEIFANAPDFDEEEPKGFDRALVDAKYAKETNENLFWVHGGLSAWAVFYLAKVRSSRRRNGSLPGLKETIRSFENESIEVRTAVAKGINNALPSDVQKKYQNYAPNSNKRQRTVDITIDPAEDQQETPVHTSIALADDIEAATDTFQDNPYYRLSFPLALKAMNLFPEILFNAISQERSISNSGVWTAGIEMAFAVGKNFNNKLDSIMSLTIVSNQVAFIAQHLFGVHIVSTDDRRYILDNHTGMITRPRPELGIHGCKREVILETFGQIITSAIIAGPAYIEEEARGRRRTECVNMTFTAMVNDVAMINLYMAEKESIWVKQALWGK